MIEVVLFDGRGIVARAEAGDVPSAFLAADTLKRDARSAWPIQGYAKSLRVGFYVDGVLTLSAALGRHTTEKGKTC